MGEEKAEVELIPSKHISKAFKTVTVMCHEEYGVDQDTLYYRYQRYFDPGSDFLLLLEEGWRNLSFPEIIEKIKNFLHKLEERRKEKN